ncbi:MAG: DUF2382 domain-containing protein [Hyphomicrobiaceae bacterium]|nr:DUF2382 domain-containing protein [Hyphomicrobiaceae bacterium]
MAETGKSGRSERETVAVVPLATETARIGKRVRTIGRVQVTTRTETERHILSEELRGEQVEIERIPRDEPVEAVPPIRTENGVTIIPLVEERLHVEKRLVLVEEIRLRRLQRTEIVEVPVEVRTERAVVERVAPEPDEDEQPSRS